MKRRRLASVILLAVSVAGANAAITVTGQEVMAHCDGFAADAGGFGSYNHGVSNSLIGSIMVPDSDSFTATTASVSSSGLSLINYTTATPNLLEFHSEGDYHCWGNGGGTNTTSLGSGHVQLALSMDQMTAYDITVQILDVGSGGFTLYGAPGVSVGYGAGVGTYHLTGTLTPYASYFWDMNGAVNDSTSGVPYQHRAHMIIDAKFTTVPEPMSLIVMGGGIALLAKRRRVTK